MSNGSDDIVNGDGMKLSETSTWRRISELRHRCVSSRSANLQNLLNEEVTESLHLDRLAGRSDTAISRLSESARVRSARFNLIAPLKNLDTSGVVASCDSCAIVRTN